MEDWVFWQKITLKDKTGKNFLEIDSVNNSILLQSDSEITIKSDKINIEAKTQMNIEAGTVLNIKGKQMVNIN